MAGLTTKDRIQIAVGYGVWTAGVGFQLGCERLGAMAIPVGPGNIDMQCQFLEDFQSTVLCATASMAILMGEEIEKRGLRNKIALKKIIMGSERSSDAMRRKMKESLGVDHVFDIPGLTELYGPGTGLDCIYHEGIHYWADYYILELLNPETLEPVPPGETGEMVVTTLRKEAAPLVRYRTRDLTRLIPKRCSCGSILPMHDRLLGRSDDMFIFRAVNIYPGQIDHILSKTNGIGGLPGAVSLLERNRGLVGKGWPVAICRRCSSDQLIEGFKNKFWSAKRRSLISCLPSRGGRQARFFDHRGTLRVAGIQIAEIRE
jgi:phenylacetate-CoA ligase